ncbi:DUF3800 domain-containing protein [Mesorhizobium sp. BR1-1-7]|uniref:DUF3800 domain-containing protein n=1 Tax=Mesorhizobium sp. BR1-1-7 TaxID=2876647 RepID=UPI001CCB588D|nr:DUF3800 domain-containing protein [Mesorhizobium sp. BR1-1-7]MBZ9921682.1 DUF3800 domain-containing protein [Mesorhizobium sp. BR1-1-7]
MYFFVDESGNTGQNLFDSAQPTLYYGVLGSRGNLDVIAEPLLKGLRQELGVKRIHANELGVGRLTPIAERIARFSKKNDLRFSLYRVSKPDHAIITFFDQVFDSGLNEALPWHHYWTPLRYVLLFKVAHLFDEDLAKQAWSARREQNSERCEEKLEKIYATLLERIGRLPDARSRELITGAIKWARANPKEISFGSSNYESTLQISPNLIGFQQVLQAIAMQSAAQKRPVHRITVDRQTEFNGAQAELAEWYRRLRGHKSDLGPGMPQADYSNMPETPPEFVPGNQSAGLELVDITLWLAKRMEDKKLISPELTALFWSQAKRGMTDEVSIKALDKRWRHIAHLPEPDKPLPAELTTALEEAEAKRRKVVSAL